MSVTIVTQNKLTTNLQPNISGWLLYGYINATASALFYLRNGDFLSPQPPDTLIEQQCLKTAKLIEFNLLQDNTLTQLKMVELSKHVNELYEGDLRELIIEYVDWLKICGGYECIS